MIGRIPVCSRSLRKRSVEIDGHVRRSSAVLPFFNGQGRVTLCMVLVKQESRLYFFEPQVARPHVPLWSTIRFSGHLTSRSDGEEGPVLDGLWHYDPDWLLRGTRFADKPIIPALRHTNCCEKLPSTTRCLYFRRDLTQVQSVLCTADEGFRFAAVKDVLPTAPSESSKPLSEASWNSQPGRWRLDPIWMRASG